MTNSDKKEQPDINVNDLVVIIWHDRESKITDTDKDDYLSDIVSNFMWLRGDVSRDTFDVIYNTFKNFFDADALNEMFNKGMGIYFFNAEYEPIDNETCGCGCFQTIEYGGWYEFELIDFNEIK